MLHEKFIHSTTLWSRAVIDEEEEERGDKDYDDEDDISTVCEPKPSCVNNQKPTIGHKI